ncbi:BEN domain-containing protein 3 [Fukomys damarensis]|uniref:BEN domain-containing protein 3 n=1 Tax=Fukomys damarensis TaxID=885580 RepID=A0A091EEF9_FUKDA|nr:BEN domain-containing protein 3 [Fukomys damarensis]
MNSTESREDVEILNNTTVEVEAESEDVTLDCWPHPPDSVSTTLQGSSNRRWQGSSGQPVRVASVRRQRRIPTLFSDAAISRGCSACGFAAKQKLESLPPQFILNYVEAGNRGQPARRPGPRFFEAEQVDTSRFLDNKGQEEALSLDRSSTITSAHVVDRRTSLSSGKKPPLRVSLLSSSSTHSSLSPLNRGSWASDNGKRELDPHICNHAEIYFPDMQEEGAWLQQCSQSIQDDLEAGSEGCPPPMAARELERRRPSREPSPPPTQPRSAPNPPSRRRAVRVSSRLRTQDPPMSGRGGRVVKAMDC